MTAEEIKEKLERVRPKGRLEECTENIVEYFKEKLKDYDIPDCTLYEMAVCMIHQIIILANDEIRDFHRQMRRGTRHNER